MKKATLLLGLCFIIGILVVYSNRHPSDSAVSVEPTNSFAKHTSESNSDGDVAERIQPKADVRIETNYTGNRIDRVQTFDAEGKLRSRDTYSYDGSGKVFAVVRMNSNGEVMKMLYFYDENGNQIWRRLIDSSGHEVPLEKQKEVWGD
jgi:hypothetical protein